MLKISITLPNSAQINLESADSAVIDKILGMVLLDITRDMMGSAAAINGSSRPNDSTEETLPAASAQPAPELTPPPQSPPAIPPLPQTEPATANIEAGPETALAVNQERLSALIESVDTAESQTVAPYEAEGRQAPVSEPASGFSVPMDYGNQGAPAAAFDPNSQILAPERVGESTLSEQAFIDFCRAANPLGDMRRVVVAAEGANRFLGMNGVDAEGLGRLFDLAAWPRAHNFVQTLRNAARSKFAWLERLPGRPGYYTVTEVGRATALGR